MKSNSLILLFALATLLTFFFPAREAGAAAAAPVTVISPVNDGQCMQDCFEQYAENMDLCKSVCWTCDVWIIFCFSGSYNTECLRECRDAAMDTLEYCVGFCPPL